MLIDSARKVRDSRSAQLGLTPSYRNDRNPWLSLCNTNSNAYSEVTQQRLKQTR